LGRSNIAITSFYRSLIQPKESTALLGFSNNDIFYGDCYDLSLNNWQINSVWTLPKKYNTIISLRCPYFAKDPVDFVRRVYDNLEEGGRAFLDWGLGDHWRFSPYKVGWVKDGEHEFAYGEDNFLWSTIWDDCFMQMKEVRLFLHNIKKFGYLDLSKAVEEEVPSILRFSDIQYWSRAKCDFKFLWEDFPQLYILLSLQK